MTDPLQPMYVTVDYLATAAGVNKTDARRFLTEVSNMAISELNAGYDFTFPNIGRLTPRKTQRRNRRNPKTGILLGTRLQRSVHLYPSKTIRTPLN
jgi:nucleoid DNA-binding protein